MMSEGSLDPDPDVADLTLSFPALGPTSEFALRAAVMALQTKGVSGKLTVIIPPNPKDFPDLRFETT